MRAQTRQQTRVFSEFSATFGAFPCTSRLHVCIKTYRGLQIFSLVIIWVFVGFFFGGAGGEEFGVNANMKVMVTARSSRFLPQLPWLWWISTNPKLPASAAEELNSSALASAHRPEFKLRSPNHKLLICVVFVSFAALGSAKMRERWRNVKNHHGCSTERCLSLGFLIFSTHTRTHTASDFLCLSDVDF